MTTTGVVALLGVLALGWWTVASFWSWLLRIVAEDVRDEFLADDEPHNDEAPRP